MGCLPFGRLLLTAMPAAFERIRYTPLSFGDDVIRRSWDA